MWKAPQSLGATINTSGYEVSPFLSADKKRLYFSSNGHRGQGDADIFYSDRVYESWETWSVPVNLGAVVNSPKFDAYFSAYDTIGYFSSNRHGKMADIYQVSIGQSKTILAGNQRYATVDEWNSLIGKNVSNAFAFPHQSSLLTPSQKELLFYIVNKLMLQKDIQFHLVVREEEAPKQTEERIKAIQDHLRSLGIDAARIHDEQVFATDKTQRGVIEIKLFR
jgi:hypothetical protein